MAFANEKGLEGGLLIPAIPSKSGDLSQFLQSVPVWKRTISPEILGETGDNLYTKQF
jgi:hypothetical protein